MIVEVTAAVIVDPETGVSKQPLTGQELSEPLYLLRPLRPRAFPDTGIPPGVSCSTLRVQSPHNARSEPTLALESH